MKKVTVKGQVWTVQDVRNLLLTDDEAIVKALLLINERQTADEQAAQQTRYLNHRGFRSCHGKFSGYVAYYKHFGKLTEKQMIVLRRSMYMYAGQIFKIMLSRANQPVATPEPVTV